MVCSVVIGVSLIIGVVSVPAPLRDNGHYTILYCHGYDADLGLIYGFLVHLIKLLGVNVLSFNYDGYGLSRIGSW